MITFIVAVCMPFFALSYQNNKSYHTYNHTSSTTSGYIPSYKQEEQHSHHTPTEVRQLTSYRHDRVNHAQNNDIQYSEHTYHPQESQLYNDPQYNPQTGSYEGVASQYSGNSVPQDAHYGNQHMQQHQMHTPKFINSPFHQKSSRSELFNFHKYYAMHLALHTNASYNFSSKTELFQSIIQSGLGKSGIVGFYVGNRLGMIPFIRFEYGAMWQLLSFKDTVVGGSFTDVNQHNIGLSMRTFADLPLSRRLFLSAGLEGNLGLLNHIIAGDQYFTFGPSYALLFGATMQISRSRAVYIAIRNGQIPQTNYSVLNGTRTANFKSTSIMLGLKVISM
ncbi:MAG: hypothetical protein ACI9CD_000413 [Candidatus Deianiraeaceae bacterium]|jgi:hypothetical protein